MRGTSNKFNVGTFGAVLFSSLALLSSAPAQVISLVPEDIGAPETAPNSGGMFSWMECGRPGQGVAQQWYWYRIDSGEVPKKGFNLNLLQTRVDSAEGLLLNATNSADREFYELLARVPKGLVSSGAGQIANDPKTGQPLPFHFFQYSDFDLGSTTSDGFLAALSESPVPDHKPNKASSHQKNSGVLPSVPIEEGKTPAASDASAEQPPLNLLISAGPENSLILRSTAPGRLQSATSLNGSETIWHDEGLLSNTLFITPLESQPALFFRLVPP